MIHIVKYNGVIIIYPSLPSGLIRFHQITTTHSDYHCLHNVIIMSSLTSLALFVVQLYPLNKWGMFGRHPAREVT